MEIDDYKKHELTPTIRELYIQTQHWARHNENLIIATNAAVLSAIGAIATSLIKNDLNLTTEFLLLFGTISLFGFILNTILNHRYMRSINRLVAYEKFFGFHAPFKYRDTTWQEVSLKDSASNWESLVPEYLKKPPTLAPVSVWLFWSLYVVIFIIVFAMLITRCPAL